jgi:6-phosphofructokinase 2
MKIATLTFNPALDKNTWIDKIQPEKKLRCDEPEYEPGGGGLNVSRAISFMGGTSYAIYAAGGASGDKISELLAKEGVSDQQRIITRRSTRVNLLVTERTSGNQFRFGMPGDSLEDKEIKDCLDAVRNLPRGIEYLVASGSLPPGAPDNLYATIADIAHQKNIRLIVDTSGTALAKAVEAGIFLIKPNLRELSQIAGKEQISGMDQEEIASGMVRNGNIEVIILSMGPRGAMMVTREKTEYVVPPTIKPTSTVGAGDSMVAGIVFSLTRSEDLSTALKWGVAAGTAATMTSGAELCRKEDVERIFKWLNR